MCDCSAKGHNETMMPSMFGSCTHHRIQWADYPQSVFEESGKKLHNVRRKIIETSDENNSECAIGCRESADYEDMCICSENLEDSKGKTSDIEYTLVLENSEAKSNFLDPGKAKFETDCFGLQAEKCVQLTVEQASEFYEDNYDAKDFVKYVGKMGSTPVVAKIVAKNENNGKWPLPMGPSQANSAYFPNSLRVEHKGKRRDRKSDYGNRKHDKTEEKIHFFFPDFVNEPLRDGPQIENYLNDVIMKILTEGLAMCCKVKPAEPIVWLANWLYNNNPNIPKMIYPEND